MPQADNRMTQTDANRAERYARAAALLRRWLDEADREGESGYDWPAIEQELQSAAMRCQEPNPENPEAP